jgi:hypothetical protein
MKNLNTLVKQDVKNSLTTGLYKRPNGSFTIIQRNFEGKIMKSYVNISYGDASKTNEINANNLYNDLIKS